MSTPTRPVLRYHGGKWKIAPWIIDHFPPHRIYVEPFGGAASVLMRKPRSYGECYNDLDGEVWNLFRVLQGQRTCRELYRRLRYSPYAREEFEAAYEPTDDPVEQAARLVIRSFQGFGSDATNPTWSTGFRAWSTRSGTTPAHDWARYPRHLRSFHGRLTGVVLEHRNATEVMQAQDSPKTLHYVDPPYVHSTRSFKSGSRNPRQRYRHEMTDEDHRALAVVLHGLVGPVVLSGYHGPLYDELYGAWEQRERPTFADGAAPRTEVLWLNPVCARALGHGTLFGASA